MMEIHVKNFGPISDANIRIGKLTIFAGKNNTGKSFASRLIHSMLNSMQSDLFIERGGTLLNSLHQPVMLFKLDERIRNEGTRNRKLTDILNSIRDTISQSSSKALTLDPGRIVSKDVVNFLTNTRKDLEKCIDEINSRELLDDVDETLWSVESYLKAVTEIMNAISEPNIHDDFVKTQFKINIENELCSNFQIPSTGALFGQGQSEPTVTFKDRMNSVSFTFAQTEMGPQVSMSHATVSRFYPSNLFLESPIYWKFHGEPHNRVTSVFPDLNKYSPRRKLPPFPEYVTSLRADLLAELTGDVAFPEILNWINGADGIAGKVVVSTTGQLHYHDGQHQYPLQTTSTGVANIGIIGLLIERKLINENTVLFIDEPESNLHPAWQVLMARLLLKLAQAGITTIVATHSVDILKFIEVSAEKDPSIIELIQLNHFPRLTESDASFFDQVSTIRHELVDPYYRLYIGGV